MDWIKLDKRIYLKVVGGLSRVIRDKVEEEPCVCVCVCERVRFGLVWVGGNELVEVTHSYMNEVVT